MAAIRVRLVGGFGMEDDAGRDLAPRGAKARALVALLALTPERRRRRRWIENRLWSDRGPEQASGSLRQALTELRRALGPHEGWLQADRDEVALGALVTDVADEREAVAAALRAGRELLEGFDIRDEAWEDWLRAERARLAAELGDGTGAPAPGLPLVLDLGAPPPGLAGVLGLALASGIGRMLSEFAFVEVHARDRGAVVSLPERGLSLGVEVTAEGRRVHAVAAVAARRSHQVLWSRAASFQRQEADLLQEGELPALMFEAVDATVAALGRMAAADTPAERANALLSRALDALFRFGEADLRLADRHLAEAEQIRPSGLLSAWRAYVRQFMLIERTETDRERLLEEADAMARRAVEDGGGNPLALALAAEVRVMLDTDLVTGAVLARDAVALGPQNPFALGAQAHVLLRTGHAAEAWALAREGARIAARSRFVHWLEAVAGTAAVGAGRMDEAVRHFEAAHARAPRFRAPMRHLVFLYEAQGRRDAALAMAERLARAEPDFSPRRVAEDPDYPAATLRRLGLVRGPPG